MSRNFKNKSDEFLYNLLGNGKKDSRLAFDELYRRYSTNVYTYCRKVLDDNSLAEDVFQETFIRFYESGKKNRDMTNVSAYLIRIARNLCINEKRKKYNKSISLEDFHIPSYDSVYGDRQMSDLMQTALDALPEAYREVIVLKEFLGMTYQEIAEAVDSSMPNVRIRIHRAKNKLRKILAPYLDELNEINK